MGEKKKGGREDMKSLILGIFLLIESKTMTHRLAIIRVGLERKRTVA